MLVGFQMGFSHLNTFRVVVFFLILQPIQSHGSTSLVTDQKDEKVLDAGVILNFCSLVGKEARIAMQIASQDFNAMSRGCKLKLHFENSRGKPLQAAFLAEKLIRKKNVKAIIGLETWKGAELVAELAYRFQVPVISLARNPSGTTTPGLIEMGNDMSQQTRRIADIVQSYNRRRVAIIYEEDTYNEVENYWLSLHLSEELHGVGSEIEDHVVLPPFSSLSDPREMVKEKLSTFKGRLSPIFIILDVSLKMARHLLKEAKQMGLVGGDSIWVLSEKVFNLLDSANLSATSYMEGAIGLVTDLPRKNKHHYDFSPKFGHRLKHKLAGDFKPGFHVLRAYDSVAVVTTALNGASTTEITPQLLMKRILETKFDGLSGEVAFKDGRISNPGKVKVVSIGGGKMLSGITHYQSTAKETRSALGVQQDDPDLMKIVVPLPTPFGKFVKKDKSSETGYAGFCMDVFSGILDILKRNRTSFHYVFQQYPQTGGQWTYDDLVGAVHDNTFQAAVGDITIRSSRSDLVDFTQPYIESGLSMIVLAEPDMNKTWMFVKPFTPTMWMATGALLICTMLTVWILEQPFNPEFGGPWTDQLATALWFTFTSLFLAHRERIYRKLSRIVLVVWFFMALILTQSYPASLSSMLTVQRLKKNEITMEWLRQQNRNVGCDSSTFICDYLMTVHNFKEGNLVKINNYPEFSVLLKNRSIDALFTEYPYERAFLSKYSSGFTVTHESYRFGGFGFVFQKGSPWTEKFSKAILNLSESGSLKRITDKWFRPESAVENATISSSPDSETHSLGLESFWALYVFSLGTSILCLLLSCFSLRKNGNDENNADQLHRRSLQEGNDHEMNELHNHGRSH